MLVMTPEQPNLTPLLVCEGGCNEGAPKLFDAKLADEGRNALTPEYLATARTWSHTPHHFVMKRTLHQGGHELLFACYACGTERRYGIFDV